MHQTRLLIRQVPINFPFPLFQLLLLLLLPSTPWTTQQLMWFVVSAFNLIDLYDSGCLVDDLRTMFFL